MAPLGDREYSGWQGSLKLVFGALSTSNRFSRVAGEISWWTAVVQ
jgi:hypothetical protein